MNKAFPYSMFIEMIRISYTYCALGDCHKGNSKLIHGAVRTLFYLAWGEWNPIVILHFCRTIQTCKKSKCTHSISLHIRMMS